MKTITVFTPTFNRGYILGQLYDSLKRQTSSDFCWLIVDDGSTDNTKELVESWIEENVVSIRYYYQENGGKMRAHNYGVTLCDTELFLCCDSDDYLTDDAVEQICRTWCDYDGDNKNLNGVIGPKLVYNNGCKIENTLPEGFKTLGIREFSSVFGRVKEAFLAYRTDIISRYPFPVQDGEKFIPEGSVIFRLDEKYKMAVLPKELMICQYLEDGYTKNGVKLFMENPKGFRLLKNESVKRYGLSWKGIYSAIYYVVASLINKDSIITIFKNANNKLLTLISLPIGYLRYLNFKHRYSKV